ncbi:hypothetical protein ACOSQ4_031726 [Xanthoceras sorbifolium]
MSTHSKGGIGWFVRVKKIIASGDWSHHFCDSRKISNTYTSGASRPSASEFSVESAFTLEESVDFMCVNARNFIWSTKNGGLGKLSNNDRMRLAMEKTYAENTALKLENERLWRKLKATEASVKDLKKVISDEYMNAVGVEYVRGSTETKFLTYRANPNFDFNKLQEVRMKDLSKTASNEPAEAAAEKKIPEDSLDKANVPNLDDDDSEVVHPTE